MKRFFYIITVSAVLTFMLNTVFAQQNGNIDFEKLNDDLSIMEGIIDKLIGSVVSNEWPSTSRSQGFYVPDYGIIFSVPISKSISGPLFVFPSFPKKQNSNGLSFSFGMREPDRTKIEEQEKEFLDNISIKIHKFLGIYADAIGQMKPDDKISVYIYDNFSRSPIQLHTVLKSHISDFRSGKLDEKEFNSKILLTSLGTKNEMRSQIDILAYVLDSAVKTQSRNDHTIGLTDHGVNGLYLNDFGALFLIKTSYGQFGENYILLESDLLNFSSTQIDIIGDISADENRKRIKIRKMELEKQAKIYLNNVNNYKISFSKLLGNYGNTLRLVKNDEWVCLMTNWQNPNQVKHSGVRQNSLVIRVRKSDLVDYNRGEISNEDFFKKIKYTEY